MWSSGAGALQFRSTGLRNGTWRGLCQALRRCHRIASMRTVVVVSCAPACPVRWLSSRARSSGLPHKLHSNWAAPGTSSGTSPRWRSAAQCRLLPPRRFAGRHKVVHELHYRGWCTALLHDRVWRRWTWRPPPRPCSSPTTTRGWGCTVYCQRAKGVEAAEGRGSREEARRSISGAIKCRSPSRAGSPGGHQSPR